MFVIKRENNTDTVYVEDPITGKILTINGKDMYTKDEIDLMISKIDPNGTSLIYSNVPYSTISGIDEKRYIIKAFHPISYNDGKIYLDSVTDICKGQNINIFTIADDGSYEKYRGSIDDVGDSYIVTNSSQINSLMSTLQFPITNISLENNIIINGGTIGSFEIQFENNAPFFVNITGINNEAGLNASANGIGTKALGYCSSTDGYHTTAQHERDRAIGYKTKAAANEGLATGCATEAYGYASATFNSHTKTLKDNTVAMGYHTTADCREQLSIGRYNKPETDKLFVIGIGTSDTNRKNALTVKENGELWVSKGISIGSGNYSPTIDYGKRNPVWLKYVSMIGAGFVTITDYASDTITGLNKFTEQLDEMPVCSIKVNVKSNAAVTQILDNGIIRLKRVGWGNNDSNWGQWEEI